MGMETMAIVNDTIKAKIFISQGNIREKTAMDQGTENTQHLLQSSASSSCLNPLMSGCSGV